MRRPGIGALRAATGSAARAPPLTPNATIQRAQPRSLADGAGQRPVGVRTTERSADGRIATKDGVAAPPLPRRRNRRATPSLAAGGGTATPLRPPPPGANRSIAPSLTAKGEALHFGTCCAPHASSRAKGGGAAHLHVMKVVVRSRDLVARALRDALGGGLHLEVDVLEAAPGRDLLLRAPRDGLREAQSRPVPGEPQGAVRVRPPARQRRVRVFSVARHRYRGRDRHLPPRRQKGRRDHVDVCISTTRGRHGGVQQAPQRAVDRGDRLRRGRLCRHDREGLDVDRHLDVGVACGRRRR